MNLVIYNDDNTINSYEIKKEFFYDLNLKNKISYINAVSKEQCALEIFKSYFCKSKSILFDSSNKAMLEKLKELSIKEFNEPIYNENIFKDKDFSLLFFTSGTTGFPTGALKTHENIFTEIEVLSELINKSRKINKVIVTVPFVHYYGSLFGLFLPLYNEIDIILKEHFLPNDLLDIIDENSLVITTPLYIKSLNQLNSTKDLSKSIFISSTAPLLNEDAKKFNVKFSTNIIQIFGSTETGGIAYKIDDETLWTPLKSVQTSINEKEELKVNSPFISNEIFEQEFKTTNQTIQTFDYVEFVDKNFKLLGRSSQIIKIAGKRYSTIQIEHILEKVDTINKAVVTINQNNNDLRDEVLDITIESNCSFTISEIKNIIKKELSNMRFSINLTIVDKIQTSAVGKKILIK